MWQAGRWATNTNIIGAPTVSYQEIVNIIDAGVAAGAKIALVTEGMQGEAAASR